MMRDEVNVSNRDVWGLSGLAVGLVLAGIGFILQSSSATSRALGATAIVLGAAIPLGAWIRAVAYANRNRRSTESQNVVESLERSTSTILSTFDTSVQSLESALNRLNEQNDARFLPQGFIGLQRASLVLDGNQEIGNERIRMASLGHLPSHMRTNPLALDRGELLYDNWEPPHLVAEYVDLVNRRSDALKRFIESGGIVREIYYKASLTKYVETQSTLHDNIMDPHDEIIERLNTVLAYLRRKNYSISLLDGKGDALGPHFILKKGVGLVLDLRTTETNKHFTRTIDGLYTETPETLRAFEEKFELMWQPTTRNEARAFIAGLISQLGASKV